jgi:hypothetical protein
MPQYYIASGVRRCLAAREAHLPDIPAIIYEPGKPPVRTRIPLDQLFSPKPVIQRDYRYIRNTEYPTQVLQTEPPPIEVEPLGLPNQGQEVPLSQVVLQ